MNWKHDITSVFSFVTKDNVNEIFLNNGFSGDIGLLSIDIDGNDYWVFESIECVSSRIIVCEYNAVFGSSEPVTIPYTENFYRTSSHYSNLYWGASLPALCYLADKKGYDFIGCNSFGCNAFFVRRDLRHPFRLLTAQEGFVDSRYRDSRDQHGQLSYITGSARREAIKNMPVVNVVTQQIHTVSEL